MGNTYRNAANSAPAKGCHLSEKMRLCLLAADILAGEFIILAFGITDSAWLIVVFISLLLILLGYFWFCQ
jgi:hypothetical protein